MATQRTFTAQEAQKKFDALPQEVKGLLYSTELTSVIQKVGEKNKLHYDQMGVLETETNNVLLGFTEMGDYPAIIARSLDVERAKADTIANDINDLLFIKIRDAMKQASAKVEKSVVLPSQAKSAAPRAPTPAAGSTAVPHPVAPAQPPAPVSTPAPVPTPVAKTAATPTPPPTHAPATTASTLAPVKPATTPAKQPPTMSPADRVLSQPTVQTATAKPADKSQPDKPTAYKADPYREPID